MRIAIAQMSIEPGDIEKNLKKGIDLIKEAQSRECDLILLPEVWTTGFKFRSLKELAKRADEYIGAVREVSRDMLICGTYVLDDPESDKLVYNSFLAFYGGRELFRYDKSMLFSVTGEDRYFKSGNLDQECVFDFRGVTIGVTVCYELRFPELFRRASFRGAKIHLHPAIWPMTRLDHWLTLTRARAIENQVYLLCTNGTGISGKWELAGHSAIYSPWGEVKANLETSVDIAWVDFDDSLIEEVREKIPSLKDSTRYLSGKYL